jgi:hypothetical protein
MNPYSQTTPADAAATIKGIAREMFDFNLSQLGRTFALVNTAGQQQAVLDALPDPARELVHYALMQRVMAVISSPATPDQKTQLLGAMQEAVATLGLPLGASAPDVDPAVFAVQADGSVVFTPPTPAPEPEPEPLA